MRFGRSLRIESCQKLGTEEIESPMGCITELAANAGNGDLVNFNVHPAMSFDGLDSFRDPDTVYRDDFVLEIDGTSHAGRPFRSS